MSVPLSKLGFADNQNINGYQGLFATAWRIDMDNGLDITSADNKSTCCIFGFDSRTEKKIHFFPILEAHYDKEREMCQIKKYNNQIYSQHP